MKSASVPLPALPRLPMAVPRSGVSEQASQALHQLLDDADRAFLAAFNAGADASMLIHRRSDIVERVVIHVWRACLGEPEGCALLAVGGFGRGLLFPHSDVDLLVMVTAEAGRVQQRALERFFACLWDLGLKPGHAVRDASQCRELAAADVSVFTSLLDARRLAGDADQAAALKAIVEDGQLWPPAAFLAAKQDEQARRHAKHNDTAHNLEPNLKEGPGGLRTLDLMRWLARRVAGVIGFDGMLAAGLLDPAEREALAEAEATLRRYRVALHLEAGRAEERLLFDYQHPLALRLGFEDEHEKNLAVEQFMQGYYRAATVVERLGVQLGERFEELLEPDVEPQPLNAHFVCLGKRLQPVDADLFLRRPAALIEAFSLRLEHPQLIGFTAETMRRIQQAAARLGESLGEDDEVLAAFLELLRRGAPAVEALWRMNRFGLLASVLPAFGAVVGRMQYDLFHVYTVDEHTLRVLHNVARFADPGARSEFPLCCEIWNELDKPELLLLAALFHDIAKGRGGDHSVLGEGDARAFCRRLGLAEADVNLVAWLVRWHLLMSTTAQRRDITDPDVVHRFATEVGDWEHLDNLYLLTVADIIGTSPKLWNAWKDRLLADLYVAARYTLRSDLALPLRAEVRVRDCRHRAMQWLTGQGFEPRQVERIWADFPDLSFLRHRAEQVAWQTAAILRASGETPLVEVLPYSVRGSTELFVYAPDRDGLFATVTALLDRMRFSVVEARILGSRSGMALDTFLLLESDNQHLASPERAGDLKARLARALSAPARAQPAKRGLSRQLRHFQRPPRIEYTEDSRAGRTQMALVCSDQPGLLAVVAQGFAEAGVRVHDARIATFGERVEDFFQLTDAAGAPLGGALKQRLRAILERRIGGPAGDALSKDSHANA